MTEHMNAWLNAYHDGELEGRRLRQVEEHLADCADCRVELEALRSLRALLQESPAAATAASPERFIAQVGLRLPDRPSLPGWQRALRTGWQLAPVGLFTVWAFIQAVFLLSGALTLMARFNLGGDLLVTIFPVGQGGLVQGLFWSIALTAVIGLLSLSWLASWWVSRQRTNSSLATE